jgi:hypothetical protein
MGVRETFLDKRDGNEEDDSVADDVRSRDIRPAIYRSRSLVLVSMLTCQIIRRAVSGMLPKNTFRERRLERLKIFPGEAPQCYQENVLKTWRDTTAATTTTAGGGDAGAGLPPSVSP